MDLFLKRFKETMSTIRGYSLLIKLQLLFALLFVATITLDQKVNSFSLVLFLFVLLFSFKLQRLKKNIIPVFIFSIGYVLSFVSTIYSINSEEGNRVLERQMALFFIPFVCFSAFEIDRVKFHGILRMFFISIFIICLYLLKVSATKFIESNALLEDWFVKDNLYHSFANPIGMHATYLSLYVALAIFVGCYELVLKNTWWQKTLIFLGTLVLVITLTLLASRVVISAVFFILFLVYPFYIGKLKYKFVFLFAGILTFLIFFFLVRESSFISERFINKIGDEIKLKPFLKADSTYNPVYGGETRADRWFCAFELIKEKPVLGYGTGSEKEMLMQKYTKYNLQNAIINNYDAHNQYLAFAIKSGFFGLLFFLLTVAYGLYIALKKQNFIYLSFMLLFAVTCITENVLESNKGIFFFAFFNSIFCCFCLEKKVRLDKNNEITP